MVESNRVVGSKATPELPSAIAPPDLRREGHMGQRECASGVWIREINAERERRASRGTGKREPALVLEFESCQYKEGREEGQRKKGKWT